MSLLLGVGGLMRGIKIPQQEFALKMQEGLMREGGRICGTLRYSTKYVLLVAIRHAFVEYN